MRLRELRLKKKWSQAYIADCLNVTSQTVGNWENGKTEPEIRCLIGLADLFDISIDYLVGSDDFVSLIIDLKLSIENLDADTIREIVIEQMDIIGKKILSINN